MSLVALIMAMSLITASSLPSLAIALPTTAGSGSAATSGCAAQKTDTTPVGITRMDAKALCQDLQLSDNSATQVPELCPSRLAAQCDPAVIQVGIPCGMEEMCGQNPCMCGAADQWGDCACNGLRDVSPTITYTSSDDHVASVVFLLGSYWLVPHGRGTATITCTAELMHYQTSSTTFQVVTDGLMPADGWFLAACLGIIAVIVGIVLLCVHLVRRHRNKHQKTPLALISIIGMTGLLLMSAMILTGCTKVNIDDASPSSTSATFSTAGNRDERSQKIDVTIAFDQPIKASGSWTDDCDITLNGEPVDAKTVRITGTSTDGSLVLSITPTDAAIASGGTFALHQAQISIASKRSDGALPSVTSTDGKSTAVLQEPITGTLPSGLSIEVVSQTTGSIHDAAPASVTFSVTSPAMVRALTWFSLDDGETSFYKHNHTFATSDAAACADDLAKTIARDCTGRFSAKADGTTVTVTATTVVDGQVIDPLVVEGVGVFGGDYDPSQDGE